MGGGLIQIVQYGSQDEYITGDPSITFFKVAYNKHFNFAIESVEQTVNRTNDTATIEISRNGDLVTNCWLEIELNESITTEDINELKGTDFLDHIDFLIGNQLIDRHYGNFYKLWNELSLNRKNIEGYNTLNSINDENNKTYIPLQFFFNKKSELALPLIALQYHEVGFYIKFLNSDKIKNVRMFVDYIYLEQEERVKFAQMKHTILIEQIQFAQSYNNVINLNFKHPVKELIWNFETMSPDGSGKTTIMLNEFKKVSDREQMYFTHIQPFQHHTNIPQSNNIFVYSFALKPEDYQPTGTCNFSRLKNVQINNSSSQYTGMKVYGISYNILQIESGMAGLVFSM